MTPVHTSLLETIPTALNMLEEHNKRIIAITMTKEELEHILKVLQEYAPAWSH